MHQDVQDKLYNEVKDIVNEEGLVQNSQDLKKLKYLSNIIKETLRLRSPGALILLEAIKDVEFKSGVKISKGTLVAVLSRVLALQEENFANPTKFDPGNKDNTLI
jgi:cytochrome P450 family 4